MKRWGFKCQICNNSVKELFNCDLSFDNRTVFVRLCHKCMRRVGLKEEKKDEGNS